MKLLMGALGLILIYLAASGKLREVTQTLILPGGMPGSVGARPVAAARGDNSSMVVAPSSGQAHPGR